MDGDQLVTKHNPQFFKNKDYQDFIDSMAYEIVKLQAEQFPGHVDLYTDAFLKSRKDSGSPIKSVFDALQAFQVIATDNNIRDFALTRY